MAGPGGEDHPVRQPGGGGLGGRVQAQPRHLAPARLRPQQRGHREEAAAAGPTLAHSIQSFQ